MRNKIILILFFIFIVILLKVAHSSENIKQQSEFSIHFWPAGGHDELLGPIDVTKDENNMYWAISNIDNKLWKIDETGKIITTVSLENISPSSIWYQAGQLYLCDPINNQLLILDNDGKVKKKSLTAVNRIVKPVFISGDNDNQLFISDIFYHQLIILDNEGNFLKAIGLPGHDSGNLYYPYGIAYSEKKGLIFVSDFGNEETDIFNINGKWIGKIKALDGKKIRGLAWDDEKHRLYAVNVFENSVEVLDSNYNIIVQWDGQDLGKRLFFPNSIRIFNNEILITDRENNRIVQRIEVVR